MPSPLVEVLHKGRSTMEDEEESKPIDCDKVRGLGECSQCDKDRPFYKVINSTKGREHEAL